MTDVEKAATLLEVAWNTEPTKYKGAYPFFGYQVVMHKSLRDAIANCLQDMSYVNDLFYWRDAGMLFNDNNIPISRNAFAYLAYGEEDGDDFDEDDEDRVDDGDQQAIWAKEAELLTQVFQYILRPIQVDLERFM